jgi:hypothetical protein
MSTPVAATPSDVTKGIACNAAKRLCRLCRAAV